MKYNIEYKVHYSNNTKYRHDLRNVFLMDMSNAPDLSKIEDLDDETEDEMLYDYDAVVKGLDYVYNNTIIHPLFSELYEIGASKMLSTDKNIGITILFSYDYFELFHLCLVDYFTNPTIFTITNTHYLELKNKIY
jgi:hypothetical protein